MSWQFFLPNTTGYPMQYTHHGQPFYNQIQEFYPNSLENFQFQNYNYPWASLQLQNVQNIPNQTKVPENIAETLEILQPEEEVVKVSKRREARTMEMEILSAKKNAESNIINQFYSFFGSRDKSQKLVRKSIELMRKNEPNCDKILSIFYLAIRYINIKRGRKYVNVTMLLKLFTPEELGEYLPEIKQKVLESDFLSVEELCQIFRRCSYYFLKNTCVSATLTSKRITSISKEEHLKRRRRMLKAISGS